MFRIAGPNRVRIEGWEWWNTLIHWEYLLVDRIHSNWVGAHIMPANLCSDGALAFNEQQLMNELSWLKKGGAIGILAATVILALIQITPQTISSIKGWSKVALQVGNQIRWSLGCVSQWNLPFQLRRWIEDHESHWTTKWKHWCSRWDIVCWFKSCGHFFLKCLEQDQELVW